MDVKLVVFKRDGRRKSISLKEFPTVIGRNEKCDLQIPILTVSRQHCQIDFSNDMLILKDFESSNGTYVNNEKIRETKLEAGDRIVVGPVVFTVQIDGQPAEITPVKTKGEQLAETSAENIEDMSLEDAIAQEVSSSDRTSAPPVPGDLDEEEFDPISALEALADEQDEKG